MRRTAVVLAGGLLVALVGLNLWSPQSTAADNKGGDQRNAPQPASTDDMELLQGTWEREIRPEEKVDYKRCIKQISGNREVVTYYDGDGKLQRAHEVEFRVERHGPVKVFTFWNYEVIDGQDKGQRIEEKRSYVYRLNGDELAEVWGFLPGQEKRPITYHTHRRVKDLNALPAAAREKGGGDQPAAAPQPKQP